MLNCSLVELTGRGMRYDGSLPHLKVAKNAVIAVCVLNSQLNM